MSGHVRERSPGRWELRLYLGRDPLSGRKRYETKTVAAGAKIEAQYALHEWAKEVAEVGVSDAMTFGELLDKWFAVASPYMVPAGQRETRWIVERRLAPLHAVSTAVLAGRTGTAVIDEFYAALRDRGGLCRARKQKCTRMPCAHGGGAPLSDATVVRAHVVVRAALEQGMKWGLLDRNPAELAFAGEPDADEISPPRPEDVVRLFELAEATDPELVVLLVVSSTTGQRRGAVLALQWQDLDLEAGIAGFGHVISMGPDGPVRVARGRRRRNKKGKRTDVPLDASVTAILLAHRARCEARMAAVGEDLAPESYVFAGDPEGSRPRRPDTVTRQFRKLRAQTGLDETRLQDLRHFVVSYLIRSGVDLATVKAIVGHAATSRVTLDVYAHSDIEQKRHATGLLARLLGLPTPPPPEPPQPDTDDSGTNVIPLRGRRPA